MLMFGLVMFPKPAQSCKTSKQRSFRGLIESKNSFLWTFPLKPPCTSMSLAIFNELPHFNELFAADQKGSLNWCYTVHISPITGLQTVVEIQT